MTTVVLLAGTVVMLVMAVSYRYGVLLAVGVSVAVFYTLRSVVIEGDFDTPLPRSLFPSGRSELFDRVDLLVVLWIGVLTSTAIVLRRDRHPKQLSGRGQRRIRPRLWPIFLLVVLSTILLISTHGGLAATQRFVRLGDSGQGGTGIFLAAPALLLVVSLLRLRDSSPRSMDQVVSTVAMATAFLTFWVMGSRTPIIAAIAALILAALLRMTDRKKISLRIVAGVTFFAILLPAFAVELRTQRDDMLARSAASSQDVGFSQAINATYYDALGLAVRDSGRVLGELGPQVFLNQGLTIIPRAVWEDKPQILSVGKWLRRQYEPWVINGWPPGALGDWYLSLGLIGVVVGAVLSGVCVNYIERLTEYIANATTRLARFDLAIFWGLVLLPAGIGSDFLPRLFMWCILPLLYIMISSKRLAEKPPKAMV